MSAFRYQVASDLHIEYKNNNVPEPLDLITPCEDILILAGDIGSLYKYDQLRLFLEKLSVYFLTIYYIPGNHEYYMMDGHEPLPYTTLHKRLCDMVDTIPNITLLDRSHAIHKVPGLENPVCIAGCTLWSNPDVPIPKYLFRIYNNTLKKYKNAFIRDLAYIRKIISMCKEHGYTLLLVTHYPPTYRVLEQSSRKFKCLYANHLDILLNKESVHTWICGHVHHNFDMITPGGTHLFGNQKGKDKDNITDYKKNGVYELL